MKPVKFDEPIAKVVGTKRYGEFELTPQEIKHLRRCISLYDRIFARAYINLKKETSLTYILYHKLNTFGKFNRQLKVEGKKDFCNGKERICSFEGCQEKDNLTIDHIRRISGEVNANIKENLRLFCPKHHLLKELEAHLMHKELEVEKLKQRIEDIKLRDTTDCLGYHVLSKNKFEDEDN